MNFDSPNRIEMPRRVVVTGIGVVAPNGNTLDSFWDSIVTGTSAAAPVTKFDVSQLPVKYAAEVKDFRLSDHVDAKEGRYDRTIQYGLGAAAQALANSRLDIKSMDPERIGIVEGTTISGSESVMKTQKIFLQSRDYRKVHPYNVVAGYCGEGSSTISQHLGIQGAAITYCSGCASSNDSIGHAAKLIRHDEFDVMLAGGAEEMHEMLFVGFCKLRSMSEWLGEPDRSMRPFDRSRNGFVLGEGAAFLVLEERSHALARGATILAEVLGHGRTSEAYHPTAPHPEGVGYRAAMERALKDARTEGCAHCARAHFAHQRPRLGDQAERSDRDTRDQARVWRTRAEAFRHRYEAHHRAPHGRFRRGRGSGYGDDAAQTEHPSHDQSFES